MMTPWLLRGLSIPTENFKFSLRICMFRKYSNTKNRCQVCSRVQGFLRTRNTDLSIISGLQLAHQGLNWSEERKTTYVLCILLVKFTFKLYFHLYKYQILGNVRLHPLMKYDISRAIYHFFSYLKAFHSYSNSL